MSLREDTRVRITKEKNSWKTTQHATEQTKQSCENKVENSKLSNAKTCSN